MTKRAPQIIKCKECGKDFTHNHQGTGRKPIYCPRHRNKSAKKRDSERARKNLPPKEADQFDAQADPEEWVAKAAADSSYVSILPRLMAVGMSLYPHKQDVRRAAMAAGIYGKSQKELDDLWKEAKEHHQDTIRLKEGAMTAEAKRSLMIHLLLGQAKAHQCAPSQLGNAAKAYASVLPESQAHYSEVRIVVNTPERKEKKKK